jgi:hypothetical protein
VIRGDRIIAAHVTLPLADNFGSRQHLGHRHKAALGITEQTDAIAVIISEETGNISVGNDGELIQRLSRDKLRDVLMSLLLPSLLPQNQNHPVTRMGRVTQRIFSGWQQPDFKELTNGEAKAKPPMRSESDNKIALSSKAKKNGASSTGRSYTLDENGKNNRHHLKD